MNACIKAFTVPVSSSTEPNDTTKPKFAFNSLILSGQIGVQFFVDMPEIDGLDYTSGDQCWMTFTIAGPGSVSSTPAVRDDTFTHVEDGQTYYGFRCYINSLQMADKITATLHYKPEGSEKKTISQTLSAKDYLDTAYASFSGTDQQLLAAIKDYGHYAQIMLYNEHKNDANSFTIGDGGYAEMDAVNTDLSGSYEQVRTDTASYALKIASKDNSGVTVGGYSLNLDSSTAVNVYFDLADGTSAQNLTAYLGEGQVNLSKYDVSRYVVVIDDIPAHELGKTYTVSIMSGNETLVSVEISALSYVHSTLEQNKDNYSADSNGNCAAVTALYNYYTATTVYRQAHGYKN